MNIKGKKCNVCKSKVCCYSDVQYAKVGFEVLAGETKNGFYLI
jgi:hypothetical protein